MNEVLIYLVVILIVVLLALQVILLRRAGTVDSALVNDARLLGDTIDRLGRELREEFARSRQESAQAARVGREEQTQALDRLGQTLSGQVGQLATLQGQQLEAFAQQLSRLTQSNDQRFEQLRLSVETRLGAIQADNAQRLEEMRKTVDEKLHATLEQRLGESFKLVSERLDRSIRGLVKCKPLPRGSVI